LFWDLILKYKKRQDTIAYSKEKARERKAKLSETEKKLQHCQELYDEDPSTENMKKLEILKTEYDQLYEYTAQGVIVRSRAKRYEQGGKSNKYFSNLESSRGKKSSIRKIFIKVQTPTTNSKAILNELCKFYSNLYQENPDSCSETQTDSFLRGISMLTVRECYISLKYFFKRRKHPATTVLRQSSNKHFGQTLGSI